MPVVRGKRELIVAIHHSKADEGWVARVFGAKSVLTFGETPSEALREMAVALERIAEIEAEETVADDRQLHMFEEKHTNESTSDSGADIHARGL
jgi:predicted RNase H-like HicB family nuclease